MNIDQRLREITESVSELFAEEDGSEAVSDEETQEKTKKEPEEYNGIDDLTYTEYKDGKETHYRIRL